MATLDAIDFTRWSRPALARSAASQPVSLRSPIQRLPILQHFHHVGNIPKRLGHTSRHRNAFSEIRRQLRAIESPCDAFTSDIGIRTPLGRIRRPEVSVLRPFDEEAMTSDSPRLVVEVLSGSTERVDRLVKLDEYKLIETMDYIVIADPRRVEVGCWSRDTERAWRTETFRETDSVIQMPALGLAISLATFYERVPVTPRPRPRLVWEEADEGIVPPAG